MTDVEMVDLDKVKIEPGHHASAPSTTSSSSKVPVKKSSSVLMTQKDTREAESSDVKVVHSVS